MSAADLRRIERVPLDGLASRRLLLFDEEVSHFFFEFEPQQDIDLFLRHAHFADMTEGRLVACRDDLYGVAASLNTSLRPPLLTVDLGKELPRPLRDTPVAEAFAAIRGGGEWRGMLSVCSCGIAGCGSQYAWVRDSLCLALFTICGARLSQVDWLPFCFDTEDRGVAHQRAHPPA